MKRYGPHAFLFSLLGLACLPLLPEVALQIQSGSDLKNAAPIGYYQAIVSFLLLAPALLLPRWWARGWVVLVTVMLVPPTVIVGFYAFTQGARWDLTAHAALMQTNRAEAWEYLASLSSVGRLAGLALLSAAFPLCVYVIFRACVPSRRTALMVFITGLSLAAYGIRNVLVYGGSPVREVPVSGGSTVRMVGMSITMLHPLTLMAATHFNYVSTHDYYLRQFQQVRSKDALLAGATTIPGAISPRVVVVVIGESATRRHWSLYGYRRPTTPRLERMGTEIIAFTDVVSVTVGTLSSLRAMLATREDSIPVFRLFAGAGFTTHWLSAQHQLGFDELELSALVGSCDDRAFLNGVYDENLLPLLEAAIAHPGPQMVFVHLMGSHIRYRDRYPAKQAVFSGDNEDEQLRATYDNSIRYTDHVLAEMITRLRGLDQSACLLYVSDHGEDVFDSRPDKYLFRSDSIATDAMYEVPFVVWLSPQYIRDNAEFARSIAAAANRKYQNRGLYQALLSLARLQHPLYESRADLFSSGFLEQERRVGAMDRVYEKALEDRVPRPRP